MLLIPCPHCGPRAQTEFSYGGDATVERPDPEASSEQAWLDHIFVRDNPAGPHTEWWYHAAGCGKWFRTERNVTTHRFTDNARSGAGSAA